MTVIRLKIFLTLYHSHAKHILQCKGWEWHNRKGVYLTLWFWRLRTSQLRTISQKQSNSECLMGMFLFPCHIMWRWIIIFVSAWGFVLLVSTNWAMRRPLTVERVTSASRFFCSIHILRILWGKNYITGLRLGKSYCLILEKGIDSLTFLKPKGGM